MKFQLMKNIFPIFKNYPGVVALVSQKEDVLSKFKSYVPQVLLNKGGKTFLDLKKIAETQLINLGIIKANIEIVQECTYCLNNKYYSYRRDRPKLIEPMIAIMGII